MENKLIWSDSVNQVRRKYPAVAMMVDGFICDIQYSPFEMTCSGKELDIVERLALLLKDEAVKINSANYFFGMDWAKVVETEQFKLSIENLILIAARIWSDEESPGNPSGPK